MKIVKKLLPIGGSKGVAIPKIWLDAMEKNLGKPVTHLEMEIGETIILKAVVEKNA